MLAIALATSAAHAALTDDDRALIPALAARGHTAEPVVWNDPTAAWERFGAVVLRSTWDYHLAPAAFLAWIDLLTARGVRLVNPADVVRWNVDKRYLLELERRGAAVVPTAHVTAGDATLAAVAGRAGWRDVVAKPAISATAHRTWRAAAPFTTEDEARFRDIATAWGGALVQPFVPEIATAGEWSLVYFASRLSHAVLKRAKGGDFRVQSDFGGSWAAAAPPPAVVAAAEAVLAALPFAPASCAYARVDGVVQDGAFRLMELELVEPALFLGAAAGAVDRFADAIALAAR
jgi:glutathione synthase/RimK-type ligase-like ATP-grasp enzyme